MTKTITHGNYQKTLKGAYTGGNCKRVDRIYENYAYKIIFGNPSQMKQLSDTSVDLIVTSPPYPMIEMWDEIFSLQNSAVREALINEDGDQAFELMNKELDEVWKEVYRVLKEDGFACLNIGNATRKIGNEFKLYSSHSKILEHCTKLGFSSYQRFYGENKQMPLTNSWVLECFQQERGTSGASKQKRKN